MSPDSAITATGATIREERCPVVCVRIADGVTPDQGYAVRDTLNDAETIGWWFVNPGTFVVVFAPSTSGAEHAATCRMALARLAAEHPAWPTLAVGVAEGAILGAFTSAGILESMPFGPAISEAMNKASANAS
jgi:hypothetical protein